MEISIGEHICMTRVDSGLILLDLRKSRYQIAASPFSEILEAVARGEGAHFLGTADADWLIKEGHLREGPPGLSVRAAPASAALTDWSDQNCHPARVSPSIFAMALALQVGSVCWLKTYSLERILRSLRAIKMRLVSSNRIGKVGLAVILAAYTSTHAWIGQADRCLMKSIALYRLLIREGITAELVIGVRLAPFSAHCWVQKDGMVLNDRFERVRLFTPIVSA